MPQFSNFSHFRQRREFFNTHGWFRQLIPAKVMSVKRTRYAGIGLWLLFALLQALGVLIPRLTNIHANIWPAFGLLLLVPGILLAAVLGLTWGVVFSMPVNAVVWYLGLRLLESRRSSLEWSRSLHRRGSGIRLVHSS
jgi:hypothetical protein